MVFAIRMEKTFIHRTPFRLGKDGVMVWAMSYRLQDKWWDKDGALKRAYVRKNRWLPNLLWMRVVFFN